MEIQTRSETNGLEYHTTLKNAFKHAQKDSTVWKVSFSLNGECVRLVRIMPDALIHDNGEFIYEPII